MWIGSDSLPLLGVNRECKGTYYRSRCDMSGCEVEEGFHASPMARGEFEVGGKLIRAKLPVCALGGYRRVPE